MTLCVIFLPLVMLMSAMQSNAQDRTQNRSMVISRRGIVAAESPLAAQAGATILARGGNAIDAAVATNAVMGVVEPMMNSPGSDVFAIVYDAKTQKLYGLNASGWAPAGLTIEFLKSKGITEMPQDGIQSVTVPGAVERLVEAPRAIRHQENSPTFSPPRSTTRAKASPSPNGTPRIGQTRSTFLKRDPNAAATYLPGGLAPQVGDIFRNPDLGALTRVDCRGRPRRVLPRRNRPSAIVALSARMGGTMRPGDLGRLFERVGRADFDHLPRLDRLRNPAERPGHRRAQDAQHHGAIPARAMGTELRRRAASHDRSEKAGLCRHVPLRRAIRSSARFPFRACSPGRYAAQRAKLIDMAKANCDVLPGEPQLADRVATRLI